MKENLSALLSLLAGVGIGINIIRLFIKRNVSKDEVENFFIMLIVIYSIVVFVQNFLLK
jgi:hypothetical protein